jgi:hypothetical protein
MDKRQSPPEETGMQQQQPNVKLVVNLGQEAGEIRKLFGECDALGRKNTRLCIEAGQRFLRIKEYLRKVKKRKFVAWLKTEKFSQSSAYRAMDLARAADKSPQLVGLPICEACERARLLLRGNVSHLALQSMMSILPIRPGTSKIYLSLTSNMLAYLDDVRRRSARAMSVAEAIKQCISECMTNEYVILLDRRIKTRRSKGAPQWD